MNKLTLVSERQIDEMVWEELQYYGCENHWDSVIETTWDLFEKYSGMDYDTLNDRHEIRDLIENLAIARMKWDEKAAERKVRRKWQRINQRKLLNWFGNPWCASCKKPMNAVEAHRYFDETQYAEAQAEMAMARRFSGGDDYYDRDLSRFHSQYYVTCSCGFQISETEALEVKEAMNVRLK